MRERIYVLSVFVFGCWIFYALLHRISLTSLLFGSRSIASKEISL